MGSGVDTEATCEWGAGLDQAGELAGLDSVYGRGDGKRRTYLKSSLKSQHRLMVLMKSGSE